MSQTKQAKSQWRRKKGEKGTVARNQDSVRGPVLLWPQWMNSVLLWFRQHYGSEVRLDWNIHNIYP